jgi:hypothetical protein
MSRRVASVPAANRGLRQQELNMKKIKSTRVMRVGRARRLTLGDILGPFLEVGGQRYDPA